MLYGECWLAEAWEGGRSVPWEGVGRERMESRNLPGRGGQGLAESCLGTEEKGRKVGFGG